MSSISYKHSSAPARPEHHQYLQDLGTRRGDRNIPDEPQEIWDVQFLKVMIITGTSTVSRLVNHTLDQLTRPPAT